MENWTLLTDRARVLLAIAGDPGIRLRDIAATLGITERTARAIITDLPSAGYVIRHKDGRRNRYQIQGRLLLPGRPSSNPPSASCSTSSPADGVPASDHPRLAQDPGRRVEITHAPGGSRTLSGSTSKQGEAPAGGTGVRLNIRPIRPALATTASGLVQARGRQRTTSWRQPDGARVVLLTRRTAIPGITAPRRGRCPNRHRHIAPPASRRSARPAVPRKSCR